MENINSLPLIETREVSIRHYDAQQTTFKGKKIILKANPIFRTNYFLMCYNTSYNQINETPLRKLPRDKFYYLLFPMLGIKFFLFIFLSRFCLI